MPSDASALSRRDISCDPVVAALSAAIAAAVAGAIAFGLVARAFPFSDANSGAVHASVTIYNGIERHVGHSKKEL